MLFELDASKEVSDKWLKLTFALDGTQPCAAEPDEYVENWTARSGVSPELAAQMCAGCPFIELCDDYATTAGEEIGIWGGRTPEMRKNGYRN